MESKILVTRSSMPDFDEYVSEIEELWQTRWLTNMGAKHKQLQAQLKDYLGVENIDLFTNGHMALELSLQALGITGEVITTPFTFASTTHAIVRNNLEPVFCDVNCDDFTIDTTKLEELITEKTTAIMPVHVYGNVCNIEKIDEIAKKHGLRVIYDAAHTFGVKYKGKGIGSYGDVSCFSFHATKVFNTIEGGAVCFGDETLAKKISCLKNFGISGVDTISEVGVNAKMNEFCAAMGLCNLRHIDEEILKRKAVVERYRSFLEGVEGIRLSPVQNSVQPNYAYFPVMFDGDVFGCSRDDVAKRLEENGICARKYFYPLTNTFDCFGDKFDAALTPVALKLSQQVLTLPLYADLSLDDVDRICEIILQCKR